VTVNAVALRAAELAAVRVRVLPVFEVAGLNDAVTPVGKPETVKATAPLKPPCGATAMAAVPAPPTGTFTFDVGAESLKPGAAATVIANVACAEIAPDVPVMVTVARPAVAEAEAVSVSLLVELVLAGLNAAVTPVGNPLTVRLGEPVKPFAGVTVIVLLPDAPCVTLRLEGAAANVKLGPAFTVKLSATGLDNVPAVPVTVTVLVPVVAADDAVNVAV
jgi:hypothetical protein